MKSTNTLKKLTVALLSAVFLGSAVAQDVNYADYEGETLLMKAADRGQVAEVQRLLAAGAAVNAQDNDGETALMNARDYEGESALDKALEERNMKAVQVLRAAGAK